jgi:hypothetical protein
MSAATILPTAGPWLQEGPLPGDFYAFEDLLSDAARRRSVASERSCAPRPPRSSTTSGLAAVTGLSACV